MATIGINDSEGSEGPTAIDSDVKVMTEEDQRRFASKVKSTLIGLKISILCCGPTGVGKTSLLNGLLSTKMFGVRSGISPGDSLRRGNNEVTSITFEKKGVIVTVWDTPGLEHKSEADKEFLREIKEKCASYDLFIYCINGSESRDTEVIDDQSSLAKFTKLFGKKLWKHTVIVLTQANVIVADLEEQKEFNSDINVERMFFEKVEEWRRSIKVRLESLGVDKDNINETPIIPVGCTSSPTLPGHSENWFTELFEAILERSRFRAMMALLSINDKRIKTPQDGASPTTDSHSLDLDDQPIVISNKMLTLINGCLPAGSGLAGAAAGATAGGTIGALLIGVPSFGVFATLGLVVGGVAGATVGGGGLALITRIAAVYYIRKTLKKRRRKRTVSA